MIEGEKRRRFLSKERNCRKISKIAYQIRNLHISYIHEIRRKRAVLFCIYEGLQQPSWKHELYEAKPVRTLKRKSTQTGTKKGLPYGSPFQNKDRLDRAGHFIRTQATGAGINVARRSVNDCLYTLYIRFPSSVRTSVRMGNLNSESDTFSADVAFCHRSAPPLMPIKSQH